MDATLKEQCLLAEAFLGRAFGGVVMMTMRERGVRAAEEMWREQQASHQERFFLPGLEKLGIADEPPAIAAAKYHFLSNSLGGLELEYIEESEHKAWIRYPGPIWTYPGLAMLAMPGSFRRVVFDSWHRKNGRVMGVPSVAWVSTKFIMDGEPYDEGYFIDMRDGRDHSRRLIVEPSGVTPEYDRSKRPLLAPDLWPEERQFKARRNYSAEYLYSAFEALTRLHGVDTAAWLFQFTMKALAVQYTHEFAGIDPSDREPRSVQWISDWFVQLLRSCGHSATMDGGDDRYAIDWIPRDRFAGMGREFGVAFDAFFGSAVRMLNGRISVACEQLDSGRRLVLTDTGRWLW